MLIDELMQVVHPVAGAADNVSHILSLLRAAVIFRIDNVADYYFKGNERDFWDMRDFPNIAPPFPVMWMEYAVPEYIQTETQRITLPEDIRRRRMGFLIEAIETSDDKSSKWAMHIYPVDNLIGRIEVAVPHLLVGVTATGQLSQGPTSADFYNVIPSGVKYGEADVEYLEQIVSAYHPVFLALSFLHCKNVRVSEAGGRRTTSGKRARRASLRHHVLDIEPMRRILTREGGADEHSGLRRALHVCRGHFADYSQGAGLFGKYHGLVWRQDHVRGSAAHGQIVKEYNVKAKDKP